MLAQLGATPDDLAGGAARASPILRREQETDGSWFGRWGTNYIYGTWSVLCALNAAGVDARRPRGATRRRLADRAPARGRRLGRGRRQLLARLCAATSPRRSTASQTAWALLGLMAAGEADDPAVARGIAYLLATQQADGLWTERGYTAVGFPRVFYLRYHGYPAYFPLWALARYRNLKRGNSSRVAFGM